MRNIDLHTHSYASPDGGLRPEHYQRMLASGRLHVIAVTDHNTIAAALQLHKALGDQIIVGEEISTQQGDIIGLYLARLVPGGLSAQEAVRHIREQGGLVYVPHPFDRWRSSAGVRLLEALAGQIDILEIYNGRVFGHRRNAPGRTWATVHGLPGAASSDAHGWHGWGRTYTSLPEAPTAATLPALLQQATYHMERPSVRAILYPTMNRLRRKLGHA